MCFLVLLESTDQPQPDHGPFIDSLIERHAVLTGGPIGSNAAYVLRCADAAEAEALVATDPLVTSGAATPTIAQWQLIGVDVQAIDPDPPTFE